MFSVSHYHSHYHSHHLVAWEMIKWVAILTLAAMLTLIMCG